MPLINCNECNKQISDKAKECPNCGNPINLNSIEKLNQASTGTQIKTVLFYFGLILVPIIFAWFTLKKGSNIGLRIFALIWMVLWVLVIAMPSSKNVQEEQLTLNNDEVIGEEEVKPYLLQNKIDFEQLLISAKPSKTAYYDMRVESAYVDKERLENDYLSIIVNINPETHHRGDQFNELDKILLMIMAQNTIDYLVKNGSNPDVYNFTVKVSARLSGSSPTGEPITYPMGNVKYYPGTTGLKYSKDF